MSAFWLDARPPMARGHPFTGSPLHPFAMKASCTAQSPRGRLNASVEDMRKRRAAPYRTFQTKLDTRRTQSPQFYVGCFLDRRDPRCSGCSAGVPPSVGLEAQRR
jgi:hypothetical protein